MPRRLLKKLCPSPGSLQKRWFLRPFGARLSDPRLWTVNRRGVTSAFGLGLAICFIPLPIHTITAGVLAIALRINIPAIYGATFLLNPLTAVPAYYFAYRLGAAMLRIPPGNFSFEVSWDWVQNGLGPVWKPFLLGCGACALMAGLLGWLGLELLWRWRVASRYRARRMASTAA